MRLANVVRALGLLLAWAVVCVMSEAPALLRALGL